jgi:hypothetical protein
MWAEIKEASKETLVSRVSNLRLVFKIKPIMLTRPTLMPPKAKASLPLLINRDPTLVAMQALVIFSNQLTINRDPTLIATLVLVTFSNQLTINRDPT